VIAAPATDAMRCSSSAISLARVGC